MRKLKSSILLVVFFLIAFAVQSLQAQDPHKASARKVQRQKGIPIASLLEPGETRLVIVLNRSVHLADPPPGMSEVEWITQLADVVMRVRVESRESKLTPDQDWIKTSVRTKILQVLKPTGRRSFDVGQEASFLEEGGSLDLQGRQIDAIIEWADRFEVGKEYLIFAMLDSANDLLVGASSSYEIVSGTAFRSLSKDRRVDSISKSSVNNVLDEIQRKTGNFKK